MLDVVFLDEIVTMMISIRSFIELVMRRGMRGLTLK